MYTLGPLRRRRWLAWTGVVLTIGFVVLRASNVYGDPQPWAPQATPLMTVLSFINTAKYPPSLLFLMMTIGPLLLMLAWLDERQFRAGPSRALLMFGRAAVFLSIAVAAHPRGGTWLDMVRWKGHLIFVFAIHPRSSRRHQLTQDSRSGSHAGWLTVVTALFFLCRWFADVKRRNPSPLLRHL